MRIVSTNYFTFNRLSYIIIPRGDMMGRKINVNLREVLDARDITQMQLSEDSRVRQAAISAMCRNKNEMISLRHLERIADALNIDDIRELLTLEKTNDK